MATERRRRILIVAVAATLAAALTQALSSSPAAAADAWWQSLGFAAERISNVAVVDGSLLVTVGTGNYMSADGGHTFAPRATAPGHALPPEASVTSGGRVWEIRAGAVLSGSSASTLAPDAHAPFLGTTAHLIAAPAAVPGVVVAVASDGHVWRRAEDGGWATAFILLPAGGVSGAPQITGLQAFTKPLSAAVYLGTDGYGVLVTTDGGDDWIRTDAGLPENVLALATDPTRNSLYVATDSGLWVHHLKSFPAPPVYHDAALYLRWLGISIIGVVAAMLATLGLRVALPVTSR
jgi:hypothetical protein